MQIKKIKGLDTRILFPYFSSIALQSGTLGLPPRNDEYWDVWAIADQLFWRFCCAIHARNMSTFDARNVI